MYAIVESGGKQHKVATDGKIKVNRLAVNEGKDVELTQVLLIADGKDTIIGNPTIEGAKVIATSLGETRDDKVIVFKYKNKTRYRRKNGHRQSYTTLKIKEIVKPGAGGEVAKKPRKKATVAGGES